LDLVVVVVFVGTRTRAARWLMLQKIRREIVLIRLGRLLYCKQAMLLVLFLVQRTVFKIKLCDHPLISKNKLLFLRSNDVIKQKYEKIIVITEI
jgi:hypothetical protein